MSTFTRRFLVLWLALLAALLLSQYAVPNLSYGLLLAMAVGCPVVAGLLLWWVGLGLRQAWHRARALRQAARWKRLGRRRTNGRMPTNLKSLAKYTVREATGAAFCAGAIIGVGLSGHAERRSRCTIIVHKFLVACEHAKATS
ncbi:hypothetical protein [Hymenobacter negativus]|uniref:Uncharacterized protein n=1 Tax=Hymenobacter negativus TaxID=2795026 RepID=A0ABS3QI01_9BACT|nr:hypothetical protein [Hymenobacter negativus]MBO2010871.1 hypothetical protein [Hymenobacter negativus]